MQTADILLGWQFPTENLKDIAPNLNGSMSYPLELIIYLLLIG